MKRDQLIALLLIGILLVAVVFAPVPGHARWLKTLHDCAHGPVFGCMALLILGRVRARPRLRALAFWRQYLIAFGATALLGVATELAQIPAGGDSSLFDVRSNTLGALAFLSLFYLFDPRLRRKGKPPAARAAAIVVGTLLLAFLAAPVVHSALEYERREARFPVLADFSHGFDRYFVAQIRTLLEPVAMPRRWAAQREESAMRVTFEPGPYPGIHFIEPLPDWSGHAALALDFTNPGDTELDLVLRVHDAHHNDEYADRFNRSLRIPAGTRKVFRIPMEQIQAGPATRQLDLKNVAGVILFMIRAPAPRDMYISRVWLE